MIAQVHLRGTRHPDVRRDHRQRRFRHCALGRGRACEPHHIHRRQFGARRAASQGARADPQRRRRNYANVDRRKRSTSGEGWVVQDADGATVDASSTGSCGRCTFKKDAETGHGRPTITSRRASRKRRKNHVGDMSAAYSHAVHVAESRGRYRDRRDQASRRSPRRPRMLAGSSTRWASRRRSRAASSWGLGYAHFRADLQIVDGHREEPESFRDYKVITSPEVPETRPAFRREPCPRPGRWAPRASPNLPTIVIAPAIANALYNATGVRISRSADNAGEGRTRHLRARHGRGGGMSRD